MEKNGCTSVFKNDEKERSKEFTRLWVDVIKLAEKNGYIFKTISMDDNLKSQRMSPW